MAKKSGGKPRGVAAIEVIDDDHDNGVDDLGTENNGERSAAGTKPGRKAKEKPVQQASGSVGVAEIKKAATFANSVGGLDQAIALLQILKVAREM
jgi:hypothetical protein